jgi:nucleoside-diphosphate-sugar epimerase
MNSIKPTILLTGATGFLGSHLLKKLVSLDIYNLVVLKRSISNTFRISEAIEKVQTYDLDKISLETVFAHHKVDYILHCATDYGRKNSPVQLIIEANLLLPLKLLELGKQNGIKSFINTDTILDKRINAYSLSKKQFKEWLNLSKNSLACVNIALEHFFGPGDDKTKFSSYIIDSLLRGVESIDLTKGEQQRDFIYIDDCVDAFLTIIDYVKNLTSGFYEFEIGTNQPVTIKDFVLLIKELSGNTATVLNFGALPYRENEVMECRTNTEPICKLGWAPKFSLKLGLLKTIEREKEL